jgi:hypothetical protein
MRIRYFIAGIVLIAAFGTGCSEDASKQSKPTQASPALNDSGTIRAQIEAIQKKYDVTVNVHGQYITIGTSGLIRTNEMNQIEESLHEVFGMDFTNYTVNYNID